jgi:hypothetical protein
MLDNGSLTRWLPATRRHCARPSLAAGEQTCLRSARRSGRDRLGGGNLGVGGFWVLFVGFGRVSVGFGCFLLVLGASCGFWWASGGFLGCFVLVLVGYCCCRHDLQIPPLPPEAGVFCI